MLKTIPLKNYIKIYFWKILSIISGFLSLLIVVPNLTNDIELYGIYSLCISFTLYLSYADIGFLNSGQKYAAEAYARGNRKDEVQTLGFTTAILLLMMFPFTIAMFVCYLNPGLLINNLSDRGGNIASSIFLISGTILPFQIIIQRIIQSILIIRIKDFISLKIDVFFNLLKIGSVFYFFHGESYMIVEYFLFTILMSLAGSLVILAIIRKTENYNFLYLFKSIRLSKKVYSHTSKLAYTSLALTLAWIVYYELDLVIIGLYLTPKDVAIYAIGFTFLNFIRSLWNTVFSPFSQRFNHYVALNSKLELKDMINKIIDYTLPLCIIVTLVLILGAENIVYYWVGEDYKDSVSILQILILGTSFSFVTKPASFYFTANTEYKFLYILAFSLPIIFCSGIILFLPYYSLVGISIAKTFTMFSGFIISSIGISKIYNPLKSIKKWGINLLLFGALIIYFFNLILINFFSDQQKSTENLILLVLTMFIVILLSYLTLLLTKKKQIEDFVLLKSKLTRIIKANIFNKND